MGTLLRPRTGSFSGECNGDASAVCGEWGAIAKYRGLGLSVDTYAKSRGSTEDFGTDVLAYIW